MSSKSQKKAREVMGPNMFGIEEAIKCFGVNPSKPQLAALDTVPFSDEVLASCKDTHILVAFLPMSILDMRNRDKREKERLFYPQSWYNEEEVVEAFAEDCGEIGWYLVCKTIPVPQSLSQNWLEQQALLGKDDETPKAVVMVYTIIGHYKATGERLFRKFWARCSDIDSNGLRIFVGIFGVRGLGIYYFPDKSRGPLLGIASARRRTLPS